VQRSHERTTLLDVRVAFVGDDGPEKVPGVRVLLKGSHDP
jgi:hypothetical protein